MSKRLDIRECVTIGEFAECVAIQREVFALPEQELSPVRHFVVTKNAGGFALGAFDGERMAGFVLSVPAVLRGENAFYSHMAGVRSEYQSLGVGAQLKWAQRERALAAGVRYIKWTFEPVKARNAYFNLEKLGAMVRDYQVNFYGTDYGAAEPQGFASDRLFAEWHLEAANVVRLAKGEELDPPGEAVAEVSIMPDWSAAVADDPSLAATEQLRIRAELRKAFDNGLIARRFRRGDRPAYLLYKE